MYASSRKTTLCMQSRYRNPESGKLTVKTLTSDWEISTKNKIKKISLVNSNKEVEWSRDEKGLHLVFPQDDDGFFAHAFRIEVEGELIVKEPDAEAIA